MSSEQTFSTSDLRSTAQDHKRVANHKHKWQLGSVENVGRAGHPRPFRPSETNYNQKRRANKGAVADSMAHTVKLTRKQDVLDGNVVTDDSSGSNSDFDETSPVAPADAGVMYSFDASKGPTQGSQILNVALAKALDKFEEKETAKLVKNEYEVVDSEGESVGLTPVKKGKGKAKADAVIVPDADEDYEFV